MYEKAIQLNPNFYEAHFGLGVTWRSLENPAAAAKALRRASELRPNSPDAFLQLGYSLAISGDSVEAECAFRETLNLVKDHYSARLALAFALRNQGKFTDSLASFKMAQDQGPQSPGWDPKSTQYLAEAEQLVKLDEKLVAIRDGNEKPANARECILLGQVCEFKHWYATAVRLYAAAFAEQPDLVNDPSRADRYHAARCAVRAGCEHGADPQPLSDKERQAARQQGFSWLQDEVRAWAHRLEMLRLVASELGSSSAGLLASPGGQGPVLVAAALYPGRAPRLGELEAVRGELQQCRQDRDFADVRDDTTPTKLPKDEQPQWRKLWEEVHSLLRSAGEQESGGSRTGG
jgi:hypothetical protein